MQKKSTRVRKEEIIQAALAVVGEKGVRALTIAAIAEQAGMSEANIYRHFGGKDDIYAAIGNFIGSEVMGKAATIAGGSRRPIEKLETIFRSHISLLSEQPGIPRFVFSDDVHLTQRNVAEFLAVRIGNYVDTIAGIIAAGIEEGEIRQGLVPRETALTLLGMIQITVFRWTIGTASFDIKGDAEKLWGNFIGLVS
ncbi:MAG: TetR/AcrR family transcriptional regulator [Desulfuromonadaceae bacterium]|nr:TetR/AcrR family transcriptional regulator [Desulfuromonadaceae bacterium]